MAYSALIDRNAEFLFVEENQLLETAEREYATPFDAPWISQEGAQVSVGGERRSETFYATFSTDC